MTKGRFFWTWDNNECAWQSRPVWSRKLEEVKFGKKGRRSSQENGASEQLIRFSLNLGTVAVALEGGDISITEGQTLCLTARCIQDTRERQLVTRSELQRLRCGVGHLHYGQAMGKPYSARQFM